MGCTSITILPAHQTYTPYQQPRPPWWMFAGALVLAGAVIYASRKNKR